MLTRLPDEAEAGAHIVGFSATEQTLQITAGSTSEGLPAIVLNAGFGRIPNAVFHGIARTFSTYSARRIEITFSVGEMTVDGTVIRHPQITVCGHA